MSGRTCRTESITFDGEAYKAFRDLEFSRSCPIGQLHRLIPPQQQQILLVYGRTLIGIDPASIDEKSRVWRGRFQIHWPDETRKRGSIIPDQP
jgi:hypothetical protein